MDTPTPGSPFFLTLTSGNCDLGYITATYLLSIVYSAPECNSKGMTSKLRNMLEKDVQGQFPKLASFFSITYFLPVAN
ncbi:hypothetical protein Y032_0020g73 [Ancylostoma ceylanicum]|uniref:Uncharacterized protein n=1 Tax=Ancylostoma ceylanicum TaxID=53326 RepID=A0A016V3D1_9BILA|nr:hypothetical protein Y032_0020g73 [Ancylostoma ceylanicum]